MKISLFKLLLITILFSFSIQAQNAIKGKVLNKENNKPLDRVNIFIPELQKGTVSDKNGNFVLTEIPRGNFSVQFSYVGFKSVVKKITTGTKNIVVIKMEPTDVEIGEVVVLANSVTPQEKLPYRIASVSAKQLQSIPEPTLTGAIAQLPGVSVLSSGLGISQPVIRGMFGYRISTIMDGLRFDNQQWQNEHGLGLDNTGIGRVQVIEGPAALLYGADALGGVINLVNQKNAPVGHILGNYNLKVFSNTLGANSDIGLRGAGKDLSWQIHIGGESHADYLDGNGKKIPNTRFAGLTAKGILSYNYTSGVSTLQYTFSHHTYGVVEAGELNNPKDLSEDHFEREFEGPHHNVDFNIISLKNLFFTGKSRIKLNVGFQNNHRQEVEGKDDAAAGKDAGELDVVRNTFSYDAEWIMPFENDLRWTIGTQGRFQNNNNEGGRILIPNANSHELSAFTYLKKDFSSVLLEGGLRYDSKKITTKTMGIPDSIGYMPANDLSYQTLNGALGASFELSKNWILKVNFASGFRAPNLAELTSNGVHEGTIRYEIGNSSMKSEKNYEGDLGLIYQVKNFKVQGNYFYNRVNDYIYLNPTTDMIQNYNVYRFEQTNALLKGGEFSIDYKPVYWFDFYTSYSTVIATKSGGEYLPLMPADKIINRIKFGLPSMSSFNNSYFSVSFRNYLKQDRVGTNETTTPGYTLVDAGFGTAFNFGTHTINATLQVTNLLDKTYISHLSILKPLSVYNMGRNIVLTVNYPFGVK